MQGLQDRNRRYFKIAGITLCLESELDFDTVKFNKELTMFSAPGPGDDNVVFRHYFEMPDLKGRDLGREIYRKAPWAISKKNGTWHYLGILPECAGSEHWRFAIFTEDHTSATIYSPAHETEVIRDHGWQSLSLFPTDQIWLAPLMADRGAALLHSAGLILNGQGLLFVGHSSAGKSTTMTMLKHAALAGRCAAEILCDDRNIVRRWDGGWRLHGTWSHGDVADVSPASAPLRAVLFLQQDVHDELAPLHDRWAIRKRLLATLIRPMVTTEWWGKELDILEQLMGEVPFYEMRFTKTGQIVDQLLSIMAEGAYCTT